MATYEELYESLKRDPGMLQHEIARAVRIDRDRLHTDMLHHATVYMTWGYLEALAHRDAKKAKAHLEEELLPQARIKAELELKKVGRKATVRAIDDVAHSDPTYLIARNAMLDAQAFASVLKRVVEALSHRKDMLQSLNSRQKVELDSLPADHNPFDESDYQIQAPRQTEQEYQTEAQLRAEIHEGAERLRALKRAKRVKSEE